MPSFEKDLNWLLEEIQRIAKQSQAYAEIRAVLIQDAKRWHNYATRLEVPSLFPAEAEAESKPQIYDSLALLRKAVPLLDITSIETLQSQLSDWPEFGASWEMDLQMSIHATFWGSHNPYHRLPMWVFDLHNKKESDRLNPPNGPFLDPSLPVYKTVSRAAAVWLRDPHMEKSYRPSYSYQCVLSASAATIEDLQATDDALLVQVKAVDQVDDLYCKMVARDLDGKEIQAAEKLAELIRFDMPSDLQELTVYLIDGRGQPHDHFEETQYRCSWPQSVLGGRRRARGEGGWLEDVRQGEGLTVEFKEWLPTKADDAKRWDLHRTAVAFANTKGGVIYIGVGTRGELNGIDRLLKKEYGKEAKGDPEAMRRAYEKDLRQTIREEIEPDVKVDLEWLSCGQQTFLAIHVSKGHDILYGLVRNNEIYIRRGANNMRPSPAELAQLIQSRRR